MRRAFGLVLCLPFVTTAAERFEFVEPHMGTLFRIVLYAEDLGTARAASRAAFDRVRELDDRLSDYKPDSELNRVCAKAWHAPVEVSNDLFHVLSFAQRLARQTGGAFDVTQGPVIRLWRQARLDGRRPADAAIESARAVSGYRKLVLNRQKQTVFLEHEGMQIDLGGIAKGYAADEALLVLFRNGIRSALVAASGDLAIGDAPPDRDGWTISMEPGGVPRKLVLKNVGVSTSGDTEQFVEIDGLRYSHIVDPKSAAGLTGSIGVTVIASNAMTSDSFATAVSVLGVERGREFLERQPGGTSVLACPLPLPN